MSRPVALELGARYALTRKSAISFISFVAVAGLALSVAVLVVVISVINGMERELEGDKELACMELVCKELEQGRGKGQAWGGKARSVVLLRTSRQRCSRSRDQRGS